MKFCFHSQKANNSLLMGSVQFSAPLAVQICVWGHISSDHEANRQNKNIFWLSRYQSCWKKSLNCQDWTTKLDNKQAGLLISRRTGFIHGLSKYSLILLLLCLTCFSLPFSFLKAWSADISFHEIFSVTMLLWTGHLYSIPKNVYRVYMFLQYNKYIDLVGR